MKKTLKTFVIALIIVPIIALATACDIFNPPVPRIEWIQVDSTDHQTQFAYNDRLNVEKLTITIAYSTAKQDKKVPVKGPEYDPASGEVINEGWVSGYSRVSAGEQTLTITYLHPQGPSNNFKTTTYKVRVLPKDSATSSVLVPGQYILGGRTLNYNSLVNSISTRAVNAGMQASSDPWTLAKVDVAANIANIMMNLFFSNSLGTSHASMGAQGYSHGGTVANASNGIATMSASNPATRYVHTKQVASLTPAQASEWIQNAADDDHGRYRPYKYFSSPTGEKYYYVENLSTGSTSYYAHHYYDESDFEGFTTKSGASSLNFDSNKNPAYVYHSVYGPVRNRDIICDKRLCTVWTTEDGICSNSNHRVRYVPGFRDKLAEAIYNELENVKSTNYIVLEMYQTLSKKLAEITVDFFKDYFEARYTAAEKNAGSGRGRSNAIEALDAIFLARFNAGGSYTIGNIRNLLDTRVIYHTNGVQRDMASIVQQALIDVVDMQLTLYRDSVTAKRGSIMLEVGDRQIFGDGPMAELEYEILDTGNFSFVNFGAATDHIKMTFKPQGSNFLITFIFGTGQSNPRSLADILFTQYGSAHVNVNEFAPITQVLATEGFSVLMMPK